MRLLIKPLWLHMQAIMLLIGSCFILTYLLRDRVEEPWHTIIVVAYGLVIGTVWHILQYNRDRWLEREAVHRYTLEQARQTKFYASGLIMRDVQ
jgi:hypothetical protein